MDFEFIIFSNLWDVLDINAIVIIMYSSVRWLDYNVQVRICCWYFCLFFFKPNQPTKQKVKTKPQTRKKTPQTKKFRCLKGCELSHGIWLNFPEGAGRCQLRLTWTTFMALEMWPLVTVNVTAWITFNYSELHSATLVLTHLTRRLLLW